MKWDKPHLLLQETSGGGRCQHDRCVYYNRGGVGRKKITAILENVAVNGMDIALL